MNFDITVTELNFALLISIAIMLLHLGIFIGAAITFIQWFRRAYFNLHQRNEYLFLTEGWAAGGWFVPILWWIYPVKIMWEMMTETESALVAEGLTETKPSRRYLVISWWTLWVGIALISYIFKFIGFRADYGTTIVVMRWTSYLTILYLPMTILAVRMVRSYSRMEALLPEISKSGPAGFSHGSADLLDTAL